MLLGGPPKPSQYSSSMADFKTQHFSLSLGRATFRPYPSVPSMGTAHSPRWESRFILHQLSVLVSPCSHPSPPSRSLWGPSRGPISHPEDFKAQPSATSGPLSWHFCSCCARGPPARRQSCPPCLSSPPLSRVSPPIVSVTINPQGFYHQSCQSTSHA